MIKKLILFLVFLTTIIGCTSKDYQDDADIMRNRHVKYYSEILKEYKEKTGKYPFTGISENKQTYVFIANSLQKKNIKKIPYEINEIGVKNFFSELENVLGKSINEYYDPQNFPDKKPALYMYMTQGNNFYFVVHVSKEYPYAKKIGEGYYKIEVTNDKYSQPTKLIEIDEILRDKKFIEECNKTPKKEAFFKEQEDKFLNETKK